MKRLKYFIWATLTATWLLAGSAALAHPGHNHSHWSSGWLHLALGANILLVCGFIGYALYSQWAAKRSLPRAKSQRQSTLI